MRNKKRIIISSFGIHTGGGLILLNEILKRRDYIKKVLIDERIKISNKLKSNQKIYVKKNYLSRIYYFVKIILNCKSNEILLCFNNIPPLIKPKCKTILFLQNALYMSAFSFKYSLFKNLKFLILRIIFKIFLRNIDVLYVQNNFLKKELKKKFKISKNIKIKKVALLPEKIIKNIYSVKHKKTTKKNSFFYPASFQYHKNHVNLINSLKFLKNQNLHIYLTIDKYEFKNLLERLKPDIDDVKKITNLGEIPYRKIQNYYKKTNLIFPSYVESFGLPLYEAYSYGSNIISSNRNFVSENFKYFIKFNPEDPSSIAKAIKISLQKKREKITLKIKEKNIISGPEFIRKISLNHVIH